MDISVAITSYNQKRYLREAVASVLEQTVPPGEIVICDDASTDGSGALIEALARDHPHRIRAFVHPTNLGISRNKSFALDQARGDWIILLDGDDRLRPRKLELTHRTHQLHPEAQVLFANYAFVDSEGHETGRWIEAGSPSPPEGNALVEVFAKTFPRGNLFRNEAVARVALERAGRFDPTMAVFEDWDLRIRLAETARLAYCDGVLSEYRVHRAGASSTAPEKQLTCIRQIFANNRARLAALADRDRRRALAGYLDFELRFTQLTTRRLLRRGALIKAWRTRRDSRVFRSSCEAWLRRAG